MTRIYGFGTKTWPFLETLIDFLIESRELKEIQTELNIGINYSILFNSACYVEGVLEEILKDILKKKREVFNSISKPDFYARKTMNFFYTSIEKDIETRIARATGLESYNTIFKLLTQKNISDFPSVKPLMEGINVLFQFRNVLAHGREISAQLVSTYRVDEYTEHYSGGYKKAEDYLLKKGLIQKTIYECNEPGMYFTKDIADHFWNLSKIFLKEIIDLVNSLDDIDEFMDDLKANFPNCTEDEIDEMLKASVIDVLKNNPKLMNKVFK